MEELIIRVLQGRASAAEASQLRKWRSASPDNEEMYQEISAIWTDFPDRAVETLSPPTSEIRALAEAPAVIPIGLQVRFRGNRWLPTLAIAASFALLLLTADFARRHLGPRGPTLQVTELATGSSETFMTQLSDGTTVYLAPNSTLRVSPTAGVREVWLEGRAFFGVASHGDEWPFRVMHDRGAVHVLGTRFELSTADDEIRVVVVDGEVDLSSAGEHLHLGAGQMGIASADTRPVMIDGVNIDQFLAWMGQSLVFENTPLEQAAREIEARFGARVEVRSVDLGRQTISGGFNNWTFDDIVASICRMLAADCQIGEGHAVISSRSVNASPAARARSN